MEFLRLETTEYDNASIKNSLISATDDEWIVLINGSYTNGDEINQIFVENNFLYDYDAIVFAENVAYGETDIVGAIKNLEVTYYAIAVRKSVMILTGCFNEKLSCGTNYELLCRVASAGKVYCIPCENDEEEIADFEQISAKTAAYVMRKYMVALKNIGYLEVVFDIVHKYMLMISQVEFDRIISTFLSDVNAFEDIDINTAPFFVVSGDETCAGVLRDFSDSLADELVKMGQAVITTNHRYGNYDGMESVSNKLIKAYIGFQIPALESDFFRNKKGKKLQFWFDNPIFFDNVFKGLDEKYYILCQDEFYADYIRRYNNVKNAIQFPPAGRDAGMSDNTERTYDVVFIGVYNKLECGEINDPFKKGFFEYMMNHASKTFESGYREYLKNAGKDLNEAEFVSSLKTMSDVCRKVINYSREKVIETIISSGIKLHVYGDSWKSYTGKCADNLIIHPQVTVDESLEILGRSRIGLNIMTWHKAGMTERIANIMLSGAVCLSDETTYLREHFDEDEDIVLFSLDKLGELPVKIKRLLEDEELRKKIAKRAYEKASCEHVWKDRAKKIISLVDEK